MALSKITLQNNLYNVFDAMNYVYKNGEEYMATRCADVIASYLSSGVVTTTDGGTGSSGSGVYAGGGVGTMQINTTNLRNLFLTSLLTAKNNDELAQRLTNNIHSVCSASNTINTTTTGTTTFPSGTSTVDGGTAKGSFVGVSTIISSKLRICFSTMNKMTKGGNMYFAQEWADAIHTYLKGGVIKVILQSPMSGTGVGTIS
jgi:hypothetical protein